MMKTAIMKTIFAVSAFTMLFAACSKDKNPKLTVYAEENPLAKYYEEAGFVTITNFVNVGNYEMGLVFSPKVKGKINALTVKLPDVNNNLRITIWDYEQKAILRTEIVNVATANTEVVIPITPMDLVKDMKYFISMNSDDWYKRHKPDNKAATYPITAKNIVFYEYRWRSGTLQNFPTNVDHTYNGGDLSFVFQQAD